MENDSHNPPNDLEIKCCFDLGIPIPKRLREIADKADLPAWVEQALFQIANELEDG